MIAPVTAPGMTSGDEKVQGVYAGRPVTPVAPVRARAAQPADDINDQLAQLNQGLATGAIAKDAGTGQRIDLYA